MSKACLLIFELVIIKDRMSHKGQDLFYSLDEIKFPLSKNVWMNKLHLDAGFYAQQFFFQL
jgi:hypothetical protein